MPISIDNKIDKQFERGFANIVGDSLRQPVTMFLGNPTVEEGESPLYANVEKTRVWICDDPNDANTIASIPVPNIPKAKLIPGTAVVVKNSVNGYKFVELDTEYDIHFSEDDAQQISQQPIVLTQILYGTIQPAGAMSVTVKSAFYGDLFVSDIVTGDITALLDTSAAPITVPTTNNRAKGLLVQLDPVAKALSYKQSSEYAMNVSLEQKYVAGNLPLPDADKYRIGYIQLYKGQFEIVYGDIFQAPEWIGAKFSLGLDADVGSSQTLAVGDTLDIRGDSALIETEFIGAGILEIHAIPFDTLDAWDNPPDGTVNFVGQYDGDDTPWKFTGNEMRSPIPYTLPTSTSIGISAFDMVLFDSASDIAVTTGSTAPSVGHRLVAKAIQVSGGTGHTLKLPTGCTFDGGTNNTATFNSTSDFLEAWAESTTRYFCTANTVGVTFSVT